MKEQKMKSAMTGKDNTSTVISFPKEERTFRPSCKVFLPFFCGDFLFHTGLTPTDAVNIPWEFLNSVFFLSQQKNLSRKRKTPLKTAAAIHAQNRVTPWKQSKRIRPRSGFHFWPGNSPLTKRSFFSVFLSFSSCGPYSRSAFINLCFWVV